MIYEHSAVDPVSKIQVTEVNQLYDIWANQSARKLRPLKRYIH